MLTRCPEYFSIFYKQGIFSCRAQNKHQTWGNCNDAFLLLSKFPAHSSFTIVLMISFIKWSNWEARIVFSCHVFLVSFSLEQLRLPFTFMTWTFLKTTSKLHSRMPSIWISLIFPHDKIKVMHLWRENHKSEAVFLLCVGGKPQWPPRVDAVHLDGFTKASARWNC